jgi:hypothetical protein
LVKPREGERLFLVDAAAAEKLSSCQPESVPKAKP